MRLATALILLTLPAGAETISQEIARIGLTATQTRLALLLDPRDADRFALGGVTFLRAVERTFQDRYAQGLTDRTGMVPLLRLPLSDNPTPAPFDPAAITTLFARAAETLTVAQTHLSAIPVTSDFTLDIALTDLWFDVDLNATRTAGEGLTEILGNAFGTGAPTVTVRFDVADAAWLGAYAHLLTGLAQVVQAYDPTLPITRVMQARATMEALGPMPPDLFTGGRHAPDTVDMVAMLLATLDQTPDAALMAQAHTHLLSMVALNRDFWARVAVETDNAQEWLPNDAQTSALGIPVPQGTGDRWLAALADLEAALTGDKLIPYWRVGPPAGINLERIFTDPRPVDVAGWIQGWAALPYLETGTVLTPDSLNAFDQLVGGQAPLFALYLN